jgi:large subunit ribosomal protein L10Ae
VSALVVVRNSFFVLFLFIYFFHSPISALSFSSSYFALYSKLSAEILEESVQGMLEYALTEKKRNFLETIELQVALKNYDPAKDRRFSGTLRLPNIPREKFSVCILGNAKHIEEAKAAGLDCLDATEMKAMKKDKKMVKQLAKKYDAFLASSDLIKKVPRLMGPGLNKAGKFPSAINNSDSLPVQIAALKASVKFQLKSKKNMCLGVAIGNVGMTEAEVTRNIIMSVNFLVSLLKKNWQNVRRLYIKSTMGPSYKIFGL